MDLRAYGATLLMGISALWTMAGTQRERPVVTARADWLGSLGSLESRAAGRPDDPEATRALAQAYLDVRQPGLAVALVAAAPPAVRGDVRVRHVYARALVDQGRNEEALAVEQQVVGACGPVAAGGVGAPGCSGVLFASAVRRVSILSELVALGVEDAQAHPEASLVAYQNATREARVVVE